MEAREVGPWVGEQKPLGKSPLRGNPSPESTYLPTYPVNTPDAFRLDLTGGIQGVSLDDGSLVYVPPRLHHQAPHLEYEFRLATNVLRESRDCPGPRRAWQMGHIFSFHKREVVGYTPFPSQMQESVNATTRSSIFRSCPFFVVQCIYNWYPGDDTKWWSLAPNHSLKRTTTQKRKRRKKRNRDGT